jgi:hypothetical protein
MGQRSGSPCWDAPLRRNAGEMVQAERRPVVAISSCAGNSMVREDTFNNLQIRLTSAVESVRASLEPYREWIEEMLGVPVSETLTLECDSNPADAIAEELLHGLSVVSATKARNSAWRARFESWTLAPGVSPRIALSLQRERQPKSEPLPVWRDGLGSERPRSTDFSSCDLALGGIGNSLEGQRLGHLPRIPMSPSTSRRPYD